MYNNDFIDVQQPITIENIREIEERFSFAFPAEIKKHYLTYNGGYPEKCFFSDEEGTEYEVEYFIPINFDEQNNLENVLSTLRTDNILPGWLIPLANEAGGDFYCYSLREEEKGAIYYWNHEYEYGDNPEKHIRFLFSSLTDFINNMKDED